LDDAQFRHRLPVARPRAAGYDFAPMSEHCRPPRDVLVPPGRIDLQQRDMTVTVAADVPLRAVQQHLSDAGHWLPVDGDPDATVGSLVDANVTGPLRLGYGAWRDLLLGAQFRDGRGTLVTVGGQTVKNVAGYDLTKFLVGQRGVFGTLVTLTTRTYRRPAGAVLARFAPDPDRLGLLLPSPLKPQWAVLTADALLCGYLGDDRTLAFYRDRLPAVGPAEVTARSVDEDVAHRQSLWCPAGRRTFRASVPPAKVQDFVARAGVAGWSADAAFGVVVGEAADGADALRRAAGAVGGTVTVTDRSSDPPRVTFSRSAEPERALLSRLKRAFDPNDALPPIPATA
jgi:glycolate oxidase FAD binding subunit